MHLMFMKIEGIPVYRMKSINWATGEITWRDEDAARQSALLEWGRAVPVPVGRADQTVAKIPDQQAQRDGALPRGAVRHRKNNSGPVY